MACGIEVITGIQDSAIGGVEQTALLDKPIKTIKQANENGEWSLTLVFQPCADGSDPLSRRDTSHVVSTVIGSAFTSPDAFIQSHLAAARLVKQQCLVPIAVTLAQSALETGWGRSVVGNAYFGIKARPNQRSITTTTHEYFDGGRIVSVPGSFCAYGSYTDAALDYGNFLNINPRYSLAFKHVDNPEVFAQAVAAANFATDPDYGNKLISIMRDNNLEQYDRV